MMRLTFLVLLCAFLTLSQSNVVRKHYKPGSFKNNKEIYRRFHLHKSGRHHKVHRHSKKQHDGISDEEMDKAFADFETKVKEWETEELKKATSPEEREKTELRFTRFKETIPQAKSEAVAAKNAGRLETAQKFIDAATTTVDAIPALIDNDGDPLKITQNVLGLVAGLAPLFGPYGEAVSGVLGLVGSIIGMFDQTAEKSLEETLGEVIDEKLKEYDDDVMRKKAEGMKNELAEDRVILNVFVGHTLEGKPISQRELDFLHREIKVTEGANFVGYLQEKIRQDCLDYFTTSKRVNTGNSEDILYLWELKSKDEYAEAWKLANTCMEFYSFYADVVGMRDVRKLMLYNLYKANMENPDETVIPTAIWESRKASLKDAYDFLEILVFPDRHNYPLAMQYEPHRYPVVESTLKLAGVDEVERKDWENLNKYTLALLTEANLYKKDPNEDDFLGWTAVEESGTIFVVALPEVFPETKIKLHPAGPLGYFYIEFTEFPQKYAKAGKPGEGTWPRITVETKELSQLGDEHQFRFIPVRNFGMQFTHIVSPKTWGANRAACYKKGADMESGDKDPKLDASSEDLEYVYVIDACDNVPQDFYIINIVDDD
uniref:Toxin candidate TRINITY_DN40546_c0_g1_i3 n=1 Tax=Pachycerianthus maua TaxID=2736681 RepID=A0A7G7WYZ8_9CNID|nr:toxin candidate TRINITY_DN40546_c0_g1_i3 [Pachycerianthus maua]